MWRRCSLWKQSQAWSFRNKSNAKMFNFDVPFTANLKNVFKKAVSFIKNELRTELFDKLIANLVQITEHVEVHLNLE